MVVRNVFGIAGTRRHRDPTTPELWQLAGEHKNTAWVVYYFSQHAANVADNGFSILHHFSTRDEDDGFKAATVHIPGTLLKETFRQLDEAILETFLTARQAPAPAELF